MHDKMEEATKEEIIRKWELANNVQLPSLDEEHTYSPGIVIFSAV